MSIRYHEVGEANYIDKKMADRIAASLYTALLSDAMQDASTGRQDCRIIVEDNWLDWSFVGWGLCRI